MTKAEKIKAKLMALHDSLKTRVAENVGFAVFVETKDGWSYTSNCDRKFVITGLTEWLLLEDKGLHVSPGRAKETSVDRDQRLALKRKADELGHRILDREFKNVGLFLWEDDKMVFVANVRDIRERVAVWIKDQTAQASMN
jgi:hypothetical protein